MRSKASLISPATINVRVEIVGFDLPQRARGQLQRVEVLAIDEHIPAGKAVLRNSIGAFVNHILEESAREQRHILEGMRWLGGAEPVTVVARPHLAEPLTAPATLPVSFPSSA
jgi:hypothetical protein